METDMSFVKKSLVVGGIALVLLFVAYVLFWHATMPPYCGPANQDMTRCKFLGVF
jgi:hypothetical protein